MFSTEKPMLPLGQSRDEVLHSIQLTFEHRVVFTDGVFHPANTTLVDLMKPSDQEKPARALVFLDDGLAQEGTNLRSEIERYFQAHESRVELVGTPVLVPGGETCKKDSTALKRAVEAIQDGKLCRHSYVIAVGGGAVLDMVCFAASIVHRGIRQIRVPTTVLAQNDAGIGVKNGIDWLGKKNFLGSFYIPHAVVNDANFLTTVSDTEWRNGIAEAIKVALIRDRDFFLWIEQKAKKLASRDMEAMRILIRRCAELHLRHIAQGGDPFERGSARPLDFGHWSAHKLEQLSGFQIGHGHAVAVGMAIDCVYSNRIGLLGKEELSRILECLAQIGFPLQVGRFVPLARQDAIGAVLEGLSEFQEHLGGRLCVTLLKSIGTSVDVSEFDRSLLKKVIAEVLFEEEQIKPPIHIDVFQEQSQGEIRALLNEILATLAAQVGTIHRMDLREQNLHLVATTAGVPIPVLEQIKKIPLGKGIAGAAAAEKRPVSICNLQAAGNRVARPGAKATGVQTSLCVPILMGEQVIGTLGAGWMREKPLLESDYNALARSAELLAIHLAENQANF